MAVWVRTQCCKSWEPSGLTVNMQALILLESVWMCTDVSHTLLLAVLHQLECTKYTIMVFLAAISAMRRLLSGFPYCSYDA